MKVGIWCKKRGHKLTWEKSGIHMSSIKVSVKFLSLSLSPFLPFFSLYSFFIFFLPFLSLSLSHENWSWFNKMHSLSLSLRGRERKEGKRENLSPYFLPLWIYLHRFKQIPLSIFCSPSLFNPFTSSTSSLPDDGDEDERYREKGSREEEGKK